VKKLPARAQRKRENMATSNGKEAQGEEVKTPPPAGSIGGYESLHRLLEANLSPQLFQVPYHYLIPSLGGGPDSSHRAVARARFLVMPYPSSVAHACSGELFSPAESTLSHNQITTGKSARSN